MQEEKIIRFEINPHNKQLLELQIESKDFYSIYSESTTFELIVDLNHMAFSNIEHLSERLFGWLSSFAVNINIVVNNIPEDVVSKTTNINLFNSIINKIEICQSTRFLKFTVIQANMFDCNNISRITRLTNLKIIDLKDINIQQNEINNYISIMIDLLNKIPKNSKINKIILPENFKKQVLNVENCLENEFFVAIKRSLLETLSLIEISKLPTFLGLQEDIQSIMNVKQGSDLEKLYYSHDRDLENLIQLKKIPFPTHDINMLINNINNKLNTTFKDLERFIPIINNIKPKNIYWLDKILREKLNNSNYIITCLNAVKMCNDTLFKMLQSLVSDLIACRIKEINPYDDKLTEFLFADEIISKDSILRTILKIHLEFDLSKDDYLSKVFANILEEYINYSSGIKLPNDHNRLIYYNKIEYVNLLMALANNMLYLNNNNKNHELITEEQKTRTNIEIEQLESFKEILFAFNGKIHSSYKNFLYNHKVVNLNSYQPPAPM